jgi:hypothetical protein
MADLPHYRPAVFYDTARMMRRRNLGAALLAISAIPPGVHLPTLSLTLTVTNPTVTVSGTQTDQQRPKSVFIDAQVTQRRRNVAAIYQALVGAPASGGTVALPTLVLNMLAPDPTVSIASQIFSGQDTQGEREPEVWQPGRRTYLFAYQAPGSRAVNLPQLSLTLTAPAPSVSLSGIVFLPQLSLTLSAPDASISQTNTGRVDLPLMQLSLTTLPLTFDIVGPGRVDLPVMALDLVALDPTLAQFYKGLEINIINQSGCIRIRST